MPTPTATTRLAHRATCVEQWIGELATDALLAEANLPGKPGLVSPDGNHSHSDMNLATMHASARALRPWFAALARLGTRCADNAETRRQAGLLGRRAEQHMLAATDGVNTHRGALWAMGLLAVAAGRIAINQDDATGLDPHQVVAEAAGIAAEPDPAPAAYRPDLAGARARHRYKVGGAEAEAIAGFPHAMAALRRLQTGQDALDALLTCMTSLDDTCLLHRGGPAGLRLVQEGAAMVVALGINTPEGRDALEALRRSMSERRLSPGGSADLLAAALFLNRLSAGPHTNFTQEEPCRR